MLKQVSVGLNGADFHDGECLAKQVADGFAKTGVRNVGADEHEAGVGQCLNDLHNFRVLDKLVSVVEGNGCNVGAIDGVLNFGTAAEPRWPLPMQMKITSAVSVPRRMSSVSFCPLAC